MSIQSLFHRAAPLVVLVFLVSCGGTSRNVAEQEDVPAVAKLGKRYETILVDEFTMRPEIGKDYPQAADTLRQSMMTALKKKKVFKVVADAAGKTARDSGTLLVGGDISNLRIVSDSARFWGGAFAGSSGVELDLILTDGATGKVVRRETMSSWNNAFAAAWSWGSSDHSLLDDMGVILAEYLVKSMPEK